MHPDELADTIGTSALIEWAAFYLHDANEQDPEIGPWDDADSTRRKLERSERRKT